LIIDSSEFRLDQAIIISAFNKEQLKNTGIKHYSMSDVSRWQRDWMFSAFGV
jgi:hypothetical protein